jgi:hypothetical protein
VGYDAGGIYFYTNTSQSAGTSSTQRMYISDNGNVIVGVASPASILSVGNSGSTGLTIENSPNGGSPVDGIVFADGAFPTQYTNSISSMISASQGEIAFNVLTGASTRATIMTLFNNAVGIGTTTPATALDVNGDVTDENVKSALFLGTNGTGKLIGVTTSTLKGYTDTFGYATSTSGATGANPSTSIGTSVVNGSASTFMRSDAAPTINTAATFSFSALGNTTSTANISAKTFTATGVSSTIELGTSANASHGCIELYDAVNSSTIDYIYASSTQLIITSSKPTFCL